jgi:hypothetical protein
MPSRQPSIPTRPRFPGPAKPHVTTMWEIAKATIGRPLGAFSGLLIVSLVLAELFSPRVRRISTGYPLTVSFVTTFIVLVFTGAVVNQIITKRLQQRWERVRSIAMQGLNSELRVARDLLHILEHGTAPFDVLLPIVAEAQKRVPPTVRGMMENAVATNRSVRLLNELVMEADWPPFAREGLAEASAYIRRSLARWSPLLSIGAEVNAASHSMLLNSAFLVDAVSELELPLAELRLEEGIVPPSVRSRFVALWMLVSAAFVFVEEGCSNQLNPGQPQKRYWPSAMRWMLASESLNRLEEWDERGQAGFQQDLTRAHEALDGLLDPLYDLILAKQPADARSTTTSDGRAQ